MHDVFINNNVFSTNYLLKQCIPVFNSDRADCSAFIQSWRLLKEHNLMSKWCLGEAVKKYTSAASGELWVIMCSAKVNHKPWKGSVVWSTAMVMCGMEKGRQMAWPVWCILEQVYVSIKQARHGEWINSYLANHLRSQFACRDFKCSASYWGQW